MYILTNEVVIIFVNIFIKLQILNKVGFIQAICPEEGVLVHFKEQQRLYHFNPDILNKLPKEPDLPVISTKKRQREAEKDSRSKLRRGI